MTNICKFCSESFRSPYVLLKEGLLTFEQFKLCFEFC